MTYPEDLYVLLVTMHMAKYWLGIVTNKKCLTVGAFGCTISGAGPTCVAIAPDERTACQIAEAMSDAFVKHGKLDVASARTTYLDHKGARVVSQ